MGIKNWFSSKEWQNAADAHHLKYQLSGAHLGKFAIASTLAWLGIKSLPKAGTYTYNSPTLVQKAANPFHAAHDNLNSVTNYFGEKTASLAHNTLGKFPTGFRPAKKTIKLEKIDRDGNKVMNNDQVVTETKSVDVNEITPLHDRNVWINASKSVNKVAKEAGSVVAAGGLVAGGYVLTEVVKGAYTGNLGNSASKVIQTGGNFLTGVKEESLYVVDQFVATTLGFFGGAYDAVSTPISDVAGKLMGHTDTTDGDTA